MSETPLELRRLPVHLGGNLAADSREVYFVESVPRGSGARIMAASVDLGSKREVAAIPDALSATGIALVVDATHVYWTTKEGVFAVALAGGEVQTLFRGVDLPWGLAHDETHLYVSTLGIYPAYERGGVIAVAKTGGPARTIFAGRPASAITVANGIVYWASDGAIWSSPVAGGSRKRVVERARNPHSMLVREGLLYFGEFDTGGAVRSVPVTGGAITTLVDAEHSCSLVSIGPWLYFTRSGLFGASTLARVPFAGGPAEDLLFRETKRPRAAASSAAFFFFDDCLDEIIAFDL